MDPTLVTLLWAGAGAALIVTEVALPGMIAGFFGVGALTVAGLRALGVVDGAIASLAVWGVSSSAYVLLLRSTVAKYLGAGERTRASTSENARAYGQIVEVVEEIRPGALDGRIRFDGTSWPATSNGESIPKGGRARLVHRDDLAWVVEPAPEEAALTALPDPDSSAGRRLRAR